MKLGFRLGVACLATCIPVFPAFAGGIAQEDLTAAGAGVANAVVAGADDLSAAFYNPSGLAWQQGVQGMVGNQSRYRTLSGDVGPGDGRLKDLTIFAVSWMPEGADFGAATSIITPYSRRTRWKGAFADQLFETRIDLQRYAVDGFWRVNNATGVSLGLDMYDSSLIMNSSGQSFSGSGWSHVGAHAGLRWQFAPFWTLGVNLRQGTDVNVSNSAGANADITMPDEVSIGLAHDLLDDEMRFELDMKHSKWSSFQDLTVSNAGAVSQSLAVNMKDTTDVMLGLTWFWRDQAQFRFGYAYEQGANELNGYQPAIGDQAGHRISLGFGGEMSGMHLDMAWAGVIYPDVDVTGVYAGTYGDARYSLMFTLTKQF